MSLPSTSLRFVLAAAALSVVVALGDASPQPTEIPLPEHPRPDFQRADWQNLNGPWAFRFDGESQGEAQGWQASSATPFPLTIQVPFPWGSKLSGVTNGADIAWYRRTIKVPEAWQGKRVFLVVGACDWKSSAWLDGKAVGSYQGGYTPFDLDLTDHVRWGQEQSLVLRVDDTPHPFKLEGKQGYGPARGIWQTVYLEARPAVFLDTVHITPDIDHGQATVKVTLSQPAPAGTKAVLKPRGEAAGMSEQTFAVPDGAREASYTFGIAHPRLWRLEDPYLYEVEAILAPGGAPKDVVSTYFGMRKISVVNLPGSGYPYIALNNQPIYLQLTLDQAYHPDGFYTFPSDAFMRDEILRSRRIGLNGMRVHVKVELPRKLYWADRLGMLIMADVPNSWGQPDADMRREAETALRGMVRRDYNHPSIFSWVTFNETWGLFSKDRVYTPETQEWVASMYKLAKSLDASRLVEDNSPCNYDHVITDINSWHVYLPGYEWGNHLAQVTRDTKPGSKWNYIGGRTQGTQPLLNSECGNVWGYEGSAGDVDWTWDYHIMMNEFRRHPKVSGWLYTEHHDVINEWNGYYRFDRSEKTTGLAELAPGMSLLDLHSALYLSPGGDLCRTVEPGAKVSVPVFASCMAAQPPPGRLTLRSVLYGWNNLGQREVWWAGARNETFTPWMAQELAPLKVTMPKQPGLAILAFALEKEDGVVLHRNFTTFRVGSNASPRDEVVKMGSAKARVLRLDPAGFREAKWSVKQWNVLDGLKVNGAGSGYFEYRLPWPKGLNAAQISSASFVMEAGAKQLFGKDREGAAKQEGDFMRGQGTHDPSLNRNAYPMTDTQTFPSAVRVRVQGRSAGVFDLPDDPADHRGILSWHAQKRDKYLREAGSYGYLVTADVSAEALKEAAAAGEIVIRLEVDASLPHGLAIYGERFGRYPIDPTIILSFK